METKDDSRIISEDYFLGLLSRMQNYNDKHATKELLGFFEKDMIRLSRFIKMPKEDAIQTMKLELIEVFKRN
ncbi:MULTISPECIES: hypothetical protein [Paenibacillus]|uniref:Helix-turn-helix conjugative transposon-like domain-containing protein n=1 Tax=Paenibacillus alvei TaxID=44250 RepID=A0ABT4EAN7_PAEAL|nr:MULTISPECIES: hypothetical protein [Paenibacillus]MCY9529416.1 hypothetical protein [Paenibacillus alvei]